VQGCGADNPTTGQYDPDGHATDPPLPEQNEPIEHDITTPVALLHV
jgi:hypothetical protein